MGDHALSEWLADARYPGAVSLLADVKYASATAELSIDLTQVSNVEFDDIDADGEVEDLTLPAWTIGMRRAAAVRKALGLGSDPIDLDELVGCHVGAVEVAQVPVTAGFLGLGNPDRVRVALQARHPTARRFEVARILGDALHHPPGDVVLPVTARRTRRQQVQRAFAQELLCPIDGLRQLLPLPTPRADDLLRVADHYGVSDYTVRSALVNRGLVSREYLPTAHA